MKPKIFYTKLLEVFSNSNENFLIDSTGNKTTYLEAKSHMRKCYTTLKNYKKKKIVILSEKSKLNYCLILTILFSGNTWVPLNPDNPFQRTRDILKTLKPDLLILDKGTKDELLLFLDKNLIKYKFIDDLFLGLETEITFDHLEINPKHLSMIYFTSGSTNIPKGVMIKHESFIQNIINILKIVKPRKNIFGDYHDLSFVISIPIIFPAIMSESTIFIGNKFDNILPCNSILNFKVDFIITVPSTLERMIAEKKSHIAVNKMKTIISCGEPFPKKLMKKYIKFKNLDLFNFYGSTEVAPWIFYHKCSKVSSKLEREFVPIGNLIAGNKMLIDDDGILYIRGKQVTPGYLGEPRNNHLKKINNFLWFPTGDIVEEYKNLYFCKGRKDGQIKIRGYRVHLSDIESQINKFRDIDGCVCFLNEKESKKEIISIIITKKIDKQGIYAHLKKQLPNYMIPKKVFYQSERPVNNNGKLDRKLLVDKFKLILNEN